MQLRQQDHEHVVVYKMREYANDSREGKGEQHEKNKCP